MSLRNYEEYKTKKKELVMEKAQEDQEIRCARRMGMQATLDDAVRVANQTAPNDDKTKNIRHNRKEESILVLEANTIGARLNTDDAPSRSRNFDSADYISGRKLYAKQQLFNLV